MKSAVRLLANAENPKQAILDRIGDLEQLEVMGNRVLCATYILPEKTKGGIIMPDSQINESRYQGKVGLVLKLGLGAFVDDESTRFYGQRVAVGDWVFYRASDGWETFVRAGVPCRFVPDTLIVGKIPHPDYIW